MLHFSSLCLLAHESPLSSPSPLMWRRSAQRRRKHERKGWEECKLKEKQKKRRDRGRKDGEKKKKKRGATPGNEAERQMESRGKERGGDIFHSL